MDADGGTAWARLMIAELCAPRLSPAGETDSALRIYAAIVETRKGLNDPETAPARFNKLLDEFALLVAYLARAQAAQPNQTQTAPEIIRTFWDGADAYMALHPLDRAALDERIRRALPFV